MKIEAIKYAAFNAAGGLLLGLGMAVAPAAAAPVVTTVNADLTGTPFSFSFMGGTFSVTGNGGFPSILAVSTSGGAAVRTVFGNPSTDFVNRGTVVYDQNILGGYGSFPSLTPVPFSNSDNFLGLRVTSGGQDFFGFLFTTNSRLNSYGFETTPGVGITATTALAAAVPEPATWGMMILGMGAIGFAMRRRSGVRTAVRFA